MADNLNKIANSYALALYQAAAEAKKQKQVRDDVIALQQICNEQVDFAELISRPNLDPTKLTELFEEIAKKLKLSANTTNLLKLLANNGRAGLLANICTKYIKHADSTESITNVEVISTTDLSKKHIDEVNKLLKAKKIANPNIINTIDKSIIGGLVVKIGSVVYDFSIKNRIANLQKHLKAAS